MVLDGDQLIGVASYERQAGSDVAEVAFEVEDAHQGRGIGTLLFESLAEAAANSRHPAIRRAGAAAEPAYAAALQRRRSREARAFRGRRGGGGARAVGGVLARALFGGAERARRAGRLSGRFERRARGRAGADASLPRLPHRRARLQVPQGGRPRVRALHLARRAQCRLPARGGAEPTPRPGRLPRSRAPAARARANRSGGGRPRSRPGQRRGGRALRGDAPPARGPRRAHAARAGRALGEPRSSAPRHSSRASTIEHGLGTPAPFDAEEWRERCIDPAQDNLRLLAAAPAGLFAARRARAARGRARAPSRERHADRFERRRLAGRAVDGHGDLHLQHLWYERDDADPIAIDCLEFSEALRRIDAAAEVAFPAMDLRYRGAARPGGALPARLRARARRLRSLRGRRLLRELSRRGAREGGVDRRRGCGDRSRAARTRARRARAATSSSRRSCSKRAESGRSCWSAESSGPARAPPRRSSPMPPARS